MKSAIAHIDRALKRLYNLESPLRAEDFLLHFPYEAGPNGEAPPAALYIAPPTAADGSLSLGIYLNGGARQVLEGFSMWPEKWTAQQFAAFGLAAEEISHFHYVAHHAPHGRGVSQLELELQGEIDRFVLTLFTRVESFEVLVEKLFTDFRWLETLAEEQRARYEEANRLAKAFLFKNAALLRAEPSDRLLGILRAFYRQTLDGKISQAMR